MTIEVQLKRKLGDLVIDIAFTTQTSLTALYGKSGAGKTSIVNMIAGLLKPDEGIVKIGDELRYSSSSRINIKPHRRNIGYVFQDARLFPHLTVQQNLLYATRFRNITESPNEVIELLGLSKLLNRKPINLSGGEAQRVAIGRALISQPKLLLMDEPLASLDQNRKEEILPYIELLRDQAKIPIIYVSHSVAEISQLAAQTIIIDDGKIKASGHTPTLQLV